MYKRSTLLSHKLFSSRNSIRILLFLLSIPILTVATYQLQSINESNPEAMEQHAPPVLPPPDQPETLKEIAGIFEKNQTISEVFAEHGLSAALVQQILDCARPDYNLAKVKAGYPYHIRFDGEGQFYDFEYPIDSEKYLIVGRDPDGQNLVSEIREFPFEIHVEKVSTVIKSSLFQSIEAIGEKDALAIALEDIFSSDIDFILDIREGDSFTAIVEKKYLYGAFIGYGDVLAAAFVNDGRQILGFRFEDKNGKPAYYDPDGKSLRKSFLKSPLKFTRISSTFSLARRHPITKKVQPHLGVDYAAPVGTPVRAVGSGRVVRAGREGNNGIMVHLRHTKGYETFYLHLSKTVVKQGATVGQGELIGYVGSSGLSTGPHLDFRIRRNGKALNPLKIIYPPGDPVPPEKLDAFFLVRDKWMDQLLSQ